MVGVGVAPATDWLRGTELDATGVLTDAGGRTGLPHVYAAGDVARPFDPRIAEHARTEHWDAASRQGAAVAQSILGGPPRPTPLPSFWSDQFGSRIQLVGHASGVHEARLSGDPDDRDFSVLYMRDGRPAAGLAVGRPRELAAMRRLIEKSNPQTKETTR